MQKMTQGEIVVGLTIAELLRPCVVKVISNAGSDFLYVIMPVSLE